MTSLVSKEFELRTLRILAMAHIPAHRLCQMSVQPQHWQGLEMRDMVQESSTQTSNQYNIASFQPLTVCILQAIVGAWERGILCPMNIIRVGLGLGHIRLVQALIVSEMFLKNFCDVTHHSIYTLLSC